MTEDWMKQLSFSIRFEWDKSFEDIAKGYDLTLDAVEKINAGELEQRDWLQYPLRRGCTTKEECMAHTGFVSKYVTKFLLLDNTSSIKVIARTYNLANSHFPRPAGPHFPASQGHIKRSALEIGRARGAPPC